MRACHLLLLTAVISVVVQASAQEAKSFLDESGPELPREAYNEEDYLDDGHGHKPGTRPHWYDTEQEVPFFVNKIGPYDNPSETYEYYSLHFCRPETVQHEHASIGEDLTGDHKVSSLYDIRFRVPIHFRSLCKVHLSKEEVRAFRDAIVKKYYFEMTYDDLPLRGFIGDEVPVFGDMTAEELVTDPSALAALPKKHFLFKHMHFHILYNGHQIVHANISVDPTRVLELPDDGEIAELEFSYSASWEESIMTFKDRMRNQEGDHFFEEDLEIHWLSIMNSVVLVLLLTGFLAIVLMRILKSDYIRYSRLDDEEDDEEEYGWKLVHGDVFRFPQKSVLFCALIGLGTQCLAMAFGVLLLAILGMFGVNSGGTFFTVGIVLYALTSSLGAFVSARLYNQMGGEKWAWNIVLVNALFVGPMLSSFAWVNTVAIFYDATIAVPFGTIMIVVVIISLVGFPLSLVGGIAGRRTAPPFDAPCRTKNFAREIPPIVWYRSLPAQMSMSGFLPFSAIYIELYYIFQAVWGHMHYTLFGILFIVALILVVVTGCITVSLVYFQLSQEDYRWWWQSFMTGGSTGIFLFIYSMMYWILRGTMSGFLQGSAYFAYNLFVCYYFFITLGTVGWFSSLLFVRRIYRDLKCD